MRNWPAFLADFATIGGGGPAKGYRHCHRERQLTGTFGTETVRVPRARIEDDAGKVTEWRSKALPRYQRLILHRPQRLCCTNPMTDSTCESSVIAGWHEQTDTSDLQDQELAQL